MSIGCNDSKNSYSSRSITTSIHHFSLKLADLSAVCIRILVGTIGQLGNSMMNTIINKGISYTN